MADGRLRILVAVIAAAVVLAAGAGFARAQGIATPSKPLVNKTPVQVSPAVFHPELAVQLTLDTATPAQIVMHGKVCNQGNRDYVVPPAAEVYTEVMVYTRHPPRTWAQEGNVTTPHHRKVATPLKAGGPCFLDDYAVPLPNFSRWLKPAVMLQLAPNERLVEKQLVFRLNRLYGTPNSNSNFLPSEDGNPDNNTTYLELQYVEKSQ